LANGEVLDRELASDEALERTTVSKEVRELRLTRREALKGVIENGRKVLI
jgi:hypothetical protein